MSDIDSARALEDAVIAGAVEFDPCLTMPEGLSEQGQRAWRRIMALALDTDFKDTGGCKAFYSPQEWRERGEEYGTESELIVVYDGGDLKYLFSMDAVYDFGNYAMLEKMADELEAIGMYYEECTGWYSAVYAA